MMIARTPDWNKEAERALEEERLLQQLQQQQQKERAQKQKFELQQLKQKQTQIRNELAAKERAKLASEEAALAHHYQKSFSSSSQPLSIYSRPSQQDITRYTMGEPPFNPQLQRYPQHSQLPEQMYPQRSSDVRSLPQPNVPSFQQQHQPPQQPLLRLQPLPWPNSLPQPNVQYFHQQQPQLPPKPV